MTSNRDIKNRVPQIVHDIITHAKLTEKHEKILKQQAAAAKEVVV